VRARRRFGQHFLEPAWAAKVVQAFAPHPDDVVLEIGPGRGAITRPLAPCVERLVAVEIDRDLGAALEAWAPANVTIAIADFLEADVPALLSRATRPGDGVSGGRVRVVGNLPYNVSSPILFKLLDLYDRHRLFADATLMLQREVAERVLASPGGRDYGVLAILVGLRARVTRVLVLPPGAFRPVPKVSSTVVRLFFRPPEVPVETAQLERLVRGLFLHRRKTVLNALRAVWPASGGSAAGALAKAALDPRRRPETLDLAELARLAALWPSTDPRAVV
jgi:16S rRNA (adenine1518-N6/adenine1519-N6)-dimethyltransferase